MVECATIFLYFNYKSIMQNVTVQTGRCYLNLTEVGRTRPERTMSGVVRGLAESSVPVGGWSWKGEVGGMNCCGDRLHSLECASVLSS